MLRPLTVKPVTRRNKMSISKAITTTSSPLLSATARDVLQIVGVTTTLVALTFQMTVLYPWHERINAQIESYEHSTRCSRSTCTKDEAQ